MIICRDVHKYFGPLHVLKGINVPIKPHEVVVVTPEMDFAKEVADRIMFMGEGRLIDGGAPQEFFSRPKNERIKKFLSEIL